MRPFLPLIMGLTYDLEYWSIWKRLNARTVSWAQNEFWKPRPLYERPRPLCKRPGLSVRDPALREMLNYSVRGQTSLWEYQWLPMQDLFLSFGFWVLSFKLHFLLLCLYFCNSTLVYVLLFAVLCFRFSSSTPIFLLLSFNFCVSTIFECFDFFASMLVL